MVTEDSRDRDDAGIVRCAGSRSRVVERIFGVRRRLARSLSGEAGGGKAWNHAVDEIRRYQAAARVRIPVPADVYSRKLANLSGPGSWWSPAICT
jgi:hypothetical protein